MSNFRKRELREKKMTQQNDNKDQSKSRGPSKIWLPIVLIIGGLIGALVYEATYPRQQIFYRFPFRTFSFEYETLRAFHIILSTVGIALIIALIVVYARTYLQTKANFIFGLLIVLFALLLQALLTYQVFLNIVGPGPSIIEVGQMGSSISSLIADIFMIVAYTVFLYLSLE